MPLTDKGRKILGSMKAGYGAEKGERVFYASENKGTIKGVHQSRPAARQKEARRFAAMKARG